MANTRSGKTAETVPPETVTPVEETVTPNKEPATPAIVDPWADVTTETVTDPLPADVNIPHPILLAVTLALDEGPQIQMIEGWSDEKIKSFEKFVRLAKGPLVLTYVRVERVLRKGKKAIRITASRKPRAARGSNTKPVSAETSV